MADILHFPIRGPRPALRLVSDIDDLVAAELSSKGHEYIAMALENMASANLELNNVNVVLLDRGGDVAELVSDETIISLCQALVATIDAKGFRNADLPLRRAAALAIAEREGAHHGH
ncbi:hypothetical protein E0H64_17855 [Rhizobium leguminosarum bv. viciae]|uniref:hypothetical protein n=1 Tax=Rhizobium TaxID=379 RepID=UPI00103CE0C5|nr:hypothetical protein [Rhizobium leguminosarum]TBZ67861.1 hypothetical protein E0H64_17855 [Rhizobium leguminosarum bv. viciae]